MKHLFNLRGESIAGGPMAEKMVYIKMRLGVQNEDGSHMAPRRIYRVSEPFGIWMVGGHRADESTKEEFDAQPPEDQDADAPKLNVPGLAVTNGDPAAENGDPKAKKK
jgi:hypothetical protein